MSRRQGETILIGDENEIVIAHIGRSRLRWAFARPARCAWSRANEVVREET